MGCTISYTKKHVLVTGGSTGIGLALAELFVRDGAMVTLLARDQTKLESAKEFLLDKVPAAKVQTVAADVTQSEELLAKLAELENGAFGPVQVAVCNAGMSIPGSFVEQSPADAEKQMAVNYFGVYHTAKAVLPGMLARRSGHLCFVASAAALIGLVGYSTYSPTKYAVRGLAECLRSELLGTSVTVSLAYPPDTDTPGYANEATTRPAAQVAVNDFLGDKPYPAKSVAAAIFRGLKRGAFHLPSPDFVQQILISHCAGVTPKPLGAVLDALLAPLFTLIAVVARLLIDSIVCKSNAASKASIGSKKTH